MRIAFIYDCIYPWVKGGVEKRVYEIAKRLVKIGYEVHWFGLKWWNGRDIVDNNGIILHGVGNRHNLYDKNGKRSIGEAIYFAHKVLEKFPIKQFDVVDCQEFPYLHCISIKLKKLLMDFQLFITWYEVWRNYWFDYLGMKGIFGYITETLASKLTSSNIAISDKVKSDLVKLLNISEDKVKVIYNGVDFYGIQKIEKAEEESDIIYVGRLVPHKNIDILLKAIAEVKKHIPRIRVNIIGNGPLMPYLKNLSRELNIVENVNFYGFIENETKIYSIMKASKIFILPSTREGFPNVLLEANSCGLPVITVKHRMNATSFLIKDGYNGYIVGLSHSEIAKIILSLLQNEDQLKNMKLNSIEFAKKHDWSIIIDKLITTYKNPHG